MTFGYIVRRMGSHFSFFFFFFSFSFLPPSIAPLILVVAGVLTRDLTRTDPSTKSWMYNTVPDYWWPGIHVILFSY